MEWHPVQGKQLLAPFDHQVAGQSSMLRYDTTTVCKPLIAREHFVYKTLPEELKEFTPEYRGEIEVRLVEEDGYIQLYGMSVGSETSDTICSCSSYPDTPDHMAAVLKSKVLAKPQESSHQQNRCMIRVLRSGSYEVCPATDEVFYAKDSNSQHPHTHNLNPWSLKNHKRLLDKLRKSEHSHNKIRFILLKNVVADFRHPCILDLKIGSRLHGDDASHMKVASQSQKCHQTTSSTLGVRLCGMQVYQVSTGAYHSVDKYHGRTLNDDSFIDMLYDFLHNGIHLRTELIQPIVSRLSELIECLQNLSSYRFYASSLLIIYDGEVNYETYDEKNELIDLGLTYTTTEPSSMKQKNDISILSKDLHQSLITKSDGSLILESKVDSCHNFTSSENKLFSGPSEASHSLPQDKTVADFHLTTSLFNENMKEDYISGQVPTVLHDFENDTTFSHPHSFKDVPIGSYNQTKSNHLGEPVISCRVGMEKHLLSLNHKSEDSIYQSSQWGQQETEQITSFIHDYGGKSFRAVAPASHKIVSHLKCVQSQNTRKQEKEDSEVHETPTKDRILDNAILSQMGNVENTSLLLQLQNDPLVENCTATKTNHQNAYSEKVKWRISQNQPCSNSGSQVPYLKEKKQFSETLTFDVIQESKELLENNAGFIKEQNGPSRGKIKVDVKMIDFAHTTHQGFACDKVRHTGPDTDYILGLENLRKLFEELQEER